MPGKINGCSYNKDTNPSIEICLNCTKKVCHGTCELVSKEARDYVIRRVWTSKRGDKRISYIAYAGPEGINTSTRFEKARRYTEESAKEMLPTIRRHAGPQSKFEVVKV